MKDANGVNTESESVYHTEPNLVSESKANVEPSLISDTVSDSTSDFSLNNDSNNAPNDDSNDELNNKPNPVSESVLSTPTPSKTYPSENSAIYHKTFLTGFVDTLASIFKDKGVLLMLIIAPIIYGFFYPWPYQSVAVTHIPVGIVDEDHSRLSKTIKQYSQASPQLDVKTYNTRDEAQMAVYQGEIAGYLIIPNNLEQRVYASKPVHVSILGNNSYLLINKNVQTGFTKAIATVSAGIEVKRLVAQGMTIDTAKLSTQAVPLRIDPLFNRSEGYGAYVVPAVSIIILQQTLLMGTALLIGTWYEKRQQNASTTGWMGRITALSLISFLVGCFYYGWVFSIQDYPRGHNMAGSLVFLGLFAPTVATLGCVLGMWFRQRERSLQILVFSSLPVFFVSGYPWPVSQLPVPIQYIRWLFPSTSGMNASVQLNQIGASLMQVSGYLYHLVVLGLFLFIVLMLIQRQHNKRIHPSNF